MRSAIISARPMGETGDGTITMLFADIEGSTPLALRLGDAWPPLLASCRQVMREAIEAAGGRIETSQGDGFFACFEDAPSGLRAAVSMLGGLTGHEVRVRLGLHTGEARHTDGHYVGAEVHRAARVGGAANGGQILITKTARDALGDRVAVRDLGPHRLRGFDAPERLFHVVLEDDAPVLPPRAPAHRSTSDALIERDRELGTLTEALAETQLGNGTVLVVRGPAGCGKTALLTAAAESAPDCVALRAVAGEFEREAGFGVVRELFAPIVFDNWGRRALTGAARLAETLFAPTAETAPVPDAAALHHALYWLTAEAATRRPLLLVVDDAQWADVASQRFLIYLAQRVRSLPCALLVGWRQGEPDTDESLVGRLLSTDRSVLLEPAPLTADGTARFARRQRGNELTDAVIARCHEVSAGSPLLVRELLAEEDPGAAAGDTVPARVAGIVRARIERLGEEPNRLASALAVLGGGAADRHVARLAGVPGRAGATGIDALIAADVVARAGALDFVHPLVRRAVYDALGDGARARAHLEAADLLREEDADEEAVAGHLLRAPAGGDAETVDALLAAAERALGRGAPDAAVIYLARAEVEPPAAGQRKAVLRALGEARVRAGETAGVADLARARDLASDPAERLGLAVQIAHARMGTDFEAIARDLPEALDEGREADPETALIGRALLLAATGMLARRRRSEVTAARRELAAAPECLGRRVLAAFLAEMGAGEAAPIEQIRGLALTALGDDSLFTADLERGWQHSMAMNALSISGEWDLAERRLAEVLATMQRRGTPIGVRNALFSRMLSRSLRGRLIEAEADAAQFIALFKEHPWVPGLAGVGYAIEVLIDRGRSAQAAELLAELDLEGEVPAVFPAANLLAGRAELALLRGDVARALADLTLGREIGDMAGLTPVALTRLYEREALALDAAGRTDAARAAVRSLMAIAERHGAPAARGMALRTRAMVDDDDVDRLRLLELAADLFERSGRWVEHARTLVELGAALRRSGRRAASREPLSAGRELAHRCGAAALADRAHQELLAAGARPRRVVRTGLDALTASERRVAGLAAEGLTTRAIAEQLFVSERTIETHLRHVYRKLDVSGRGELTVHLRNPR